jgi:hypothetical protein
VDDYRGLFGLDTHDRFAGERAPAGPKYGRAGTVRQSWNDPLGFAGLDKMAPPSRQAQVLQEGIGRLEAERDELGTRIEELATQLPRLELEVRSLARSGATAALHEARSHDLASGEAELAGLRARRAGLGDTIEAMRSELEAIERGDPGDPTAHLNHPHRPVPPDETRYGMVVELWSAVSVGIILLLVAGLVFVRLVPWWAALLIGFGGYVLIEAAFRRRLTILLLRLTLVLAIVGAVILAWEFRTEIVLAAIAGLALLVVADNVREVSRR